MFHADVVSEIEIDAPIEEVWRILVDFDAYPEWNPFTRRVRTDGTVGAAVNMRVQMFPNYALSQTEFIARRQERECISWGVSMGSRALMDAMRTQTLRVNDAGRTVYRTSDVLKGALTPMVMLVFGRAMQRGFDGVARELKARAESSSRR